MRGALLLLLAALAAIGATPNPTYELRSPGTGANACLTAPKGPGLLTMSDCRQAPQQQWRMRYAHHVWSLRAKSGYDTGYAWNIVRANARGLVRLQTGHGATARCLEASREVAGNFARLMPCRVAQGQLWLIDSQI